MALEPMATSDNDLMGLLGRGDGRGLVEIIRRYQRPLIGYLTQVVNDHERARDLAQETFLRIFRHARGYRTTATFATWLYHIARNIARDELRSRRRRPQFAPDGDERIGAEAHPDDVLGASELREVVAMALEQLSERDRHLIVLRDLDGLSYEEISDRTGIGLGTVKSGLSRARGRFRDRYQALTRAKDAHERSGKQRGVPPRPRATE